LVFLNLPIAFRTPEECDLASLKLRKGAAQQKLSDIPAADFKKILSKRPPNGLLEQYEK
jgi:hypothetical protein